MISKVSSIIFLLCFGIGTFVGGGLLITVAAIAAIVWAIAIIAGV